MSYLTIDDIQLLRDKGFVSSWSGESWFLDKGEKGNWQAYVEDNSDYLLFRNLNSAWIGEKMTREQFEETFDECNSLA